jgi:hypothetical protein
MSNAFVSAYLRSLAELRRMGADTEQQISNAFGRLLDDWGRALGLIFIPEHPIKGRRGATIRPNGALLHDIRVSFGWWAVKRGSGRVDPKIAAGRLGPMERVFVWQERDAACRNQDFCTRRWLTLGQKWFFDCAALLRADRHHASRTHAGAESDHVTVARPSIMVRAGRFRPKAAGRKGDHRFLIKRVSERPKHSARYDDAMAPEIGMRVRRQANPLRHPHHE